MIGRLRLMALAALPALAGAAEGVATIRWADLRPPTQQASVTGTVAANPLGETLSWDLAGQAVELAGYLLPVDRENDLVYEFLLVPLIGACAHMPQPPPNQIVLVRPEKPYRSGGMYEPVTVTGILKPGVEQSQLFIVDGVVVVASGYSIGRAQVAQAESVPDGMQGPGATPWKFLKN